ncbi:MAG: hypothetical protein EBQ92_12315 [Proteobacteria bacterium]|nr:hypothetical protein [Pseudomonadota bacterium]
MVFWIILGIVTALILVAYWRSPSVSLVFILGNLYFVFPFFVIQNVAGSILRTDQMISRQYFLALPVERNLFFKITLARIIIFFLPFWILLTISGPNLFPASKFNSLLLSSLFYLSYFFGTSLGLLWLISNQLLYMLIVEKSLRFLTSKKRFLTNLLPLLIFFLEGLVFFLCFYLVFKLLIGSTSQLNPGILLPLVFLCFLIPVGITLITLRVTKKRWTSIA